MMAATRMLTIRGTKVALTYAMFHGDSHARDLLAAGVFERARPQERPYFHDEKQYAFVDHSLVEIACHHQGAV